MLTIFVLFVCLLQNGAGSKYYSPTKEPQTTVTQPSVILQSGTAGTSTIYMNSTSAKVNVAASAEPTYYPSGYSISSGTYVSGSVPASVQSVDTDYFIVRSAVSTNNTYPYNPSNYSLFGSTAYVSGALSDLQSNNGSYMTFRSYGSASSTNTPITNMNFTSDSTGWTYSEVDAKGYAYNGGWQSSGGNTLGSVGGCHRVIYNDTSSSQPSTSVTDYMRITYSFTTPSNSWYSQKASFAWKYSLDSGSYTTQTLTVKAKLLDASDAVLETLYSTTTMQTSWQYQTNLAIASTLSTSTTYKLQLEFSIVNGGSGNKANVFKVSIYWDDAGIKFTYYSGYTMEVEFTGTSNTQDWTKLVWTVDSAWTTGSVTVTLQLYNYTLNDWSPSGNGYIYYTSNATANTDETQTQTITTNPTHFRNGAGSWRIKVKGVKSTTTQFDFKGDWIEFKSAYLVYTASTEFVFSGMTMNTPTQLNFTVVSQYNITGVNVKIQVWNYTSSKYVTSGEGYTTYTSTGANVTKLLSINTTPQIYTSGGNARINVTGTLTTAAAYQQEVNQVKLVYKYGSSTYDYVLKINNTAVTDAWKINLKVYSSTNVTRLSSATIRFHDGTTSDQIIISGGFITQSEGSQYDLPANATRYISIVNLSASTSGTSYLYVYLKILVPSSKTYSLYEITYEIT